MMNIKYTLITLSLFSACAHAERQECLSPTLASDEIVTAIQTNAPQCAQTNAKTLWVINKVNEVAGTYKTACRGSWSTPEGYTVYSQTWSSSCGNTADIITENENPANKSFSFSTPVNTVLTGSISTTDPDEDLLSYELSSIEAGQISIDSASGAFTYTPPSDQTDSFLVIIHAKDSKGGVGQIYLFINVGEADETPPEENSAPVVHSGHHSTHLGMTIEQRGGYIDQYGFFMSAEDPDGDSITYLNTYTAEWPKNGTITNGGAGPEHKIYTPNEGYWGEEIIVIKAKDSNNNIGWGTHTILIKPIDEDEDGMPDTWENSVGLSPADPSDANQDPDQDGLTNIAEYTANTNPFLNDSDGDLMKDGFEVSYFPILNPNDANDAHIDSDQDGYTNLEEYEAGTDPTNADSNPAPNVMSWLVPVLHIILH